MIDDLIIDLPVLALFLKFMIASTALLGGVWFLEKVGVINTPDMSETAWKLAIIASFVALLPVSLAPSSLTIPVDEAIANDYGVQARTRIPLPPAPDTFEATGLASRTDTGETPATHPATGFDRLGLAPIEQALKEQTSSAASNGPSAPENASTATPSGSRSAPMLTAQPENLLIVAWAALALVALGTLALSYMRAVKSLGNRTRVAAEHHANQTLRALCEQVDIRHVPYLSRSSEINSPVCLPRREICLPDWAFEDMDEKALDSLIAHELAHMLRRDPAMMIATQTLSRIFFFQPLFALARRRLEDCAELAADQWAATHLSTAKAVASALYTCAKKITEKRQIQWGLAMAGDKSILKQRVERLLKAEGSSFNTAGRVKRGGLAAALLLAVLSFPSVEFATALNARHPHESETDEKSIKRLVRPMDAELARAVTQATAEAIVAADVAAAVAVEAAAEVAASVSVRPSLDHYLESDDGFQSGSMQWTDGDHKVKVRWDGFFSLTDDETGIGSIDPDGVVNIRTENGGDRHRLRIENEDGELELTYWVDGSKTQFDSAGQKWLADTLQILVRNTPIDMENRVTRYVEQGGTKLAFKKMNELQSDYVKRVFATTLIDEVSLDQSDVKHLIKAFKDVDSDYEMRLMVTTLVDEDLITGETLDDALDLASSVDSDYELRQLLTPMLEQFAFDDKNMKQVLERAATIDSDYELRLLLTAAMDTGKLSSANQKRLIKVSSTIESDYELRLLIERFADETDMTEDMTGDLLKAIGPIESNYEKRLALSSVVDEGSMNNANWLAAIAVAESINSDYEKRLALSQIQDDMPDNTRIAKAFRDAAETISGDYQRELLLGEDG